MAKNRVSESETLCDARPMVLVRPTGDLTESRAIDAFLERCRRVLVESPHTPILLDLREVTDADTKIIAALVLLYRSTAEEARELYVLPSQTLQDWFHLCRVGHLFESITVQRAGRKGLSRSSAPSRREPAARFI